MAISASVHDSTLEIIVKESLDFDQREAFRKACDRMQSPQVQQVIINLQGAADIDSAGLGMLLMAREEAEQGGRSLVLRKPSTEVDAIFRYACFDEKFSIER